MWRNASEIDREVEEEIRFQLSAEHPPADIDEALAALGG